MQERNLDNWHIKGLVVDDDVRLLTWLPRQEEEEGELFAQGQATWHFSAKEMMWLYPSGIHQYKQIWEL